MVQVLVHNGPPFELAVIQVELFRHFPPVLRVEEVVGASLVRRRLFHQDHSGYLRDPHLLLRVVPPLPAVPLETIKYISVCGRRTVRLLTTPKLPLFEVRRPRCCRT